MADQDSLFLDPSEDTNWKDTYHRTISGASNHFIYISLNLNVCMPANLTGHL